MDESVIVSNRTLRRVSLAVLLIDDLTGRAITGSNARAWIENEKPPIKKGDGWFVFTDLLPQSYTVNAEGGHYMKQSVKCGFDGGKPQTLRVCLKPSKTYPVPYGFLRVEGKAEPAAEVTVYLLSRQSSFKLLSDAAQGSDALNVFHGSGTDLEGGSFRIISQSGSEESVFIRDKQADNTYRLLLPLKNDYPRIGTVLVSATVAAADNNGRFFAVLNGAAKDAKIVCEAKGGKTVRKEYDSSDSDCICPDLTEE